MQKEMLHFIKMHGCGNDYIYLPCFDQKFTNIDKLAYQLSDRHKGIGGVGIVCIEKSDVADARMRMFNADGSEGAMCGNAIRCVGKYVYEHHICDKQDITIETKSGIKKLHLHIQDQQVTSVTVEMGKPCFEAEKIPVISTKKIILDEPMKIQNETYTVSCVSMGNPHAIIFMHQNIHDLPLKKIGPFFEYHTSFPNRINTEFVQIIDDHTICMRVWERVSGETQACGTGACAVVAAAVRTHRLEKNKEIEVRLTGGRLYITDTSEGMLMRGDCVEVFEGKMEVTV